MTVRAAKFADIPAMIAVMQRAQSRSEFARCTFDREEARQTLANGLNRHGHTNRGGGLILVSETDGRVRGFILGLLDSVYPFLKELRATDLLFILDEDADPRDALRMVKELKAWALQAPKVIKVELGATNAIGDWERTAKLYAREGFTQYGGIFQMTIDRSTQEAVGQ